MVFKKSKKNAIELTRVALTTGFGGSVVSGIPGGNATGLTAFSRGFGPAGSLLGAKLTLDSVKLLTPKKRRRR